MRETIETSRAMAGQGRSSRRRAPEILEPSGSPHGATGMPPTVLGVPREDYRDFLDHVVSRYERTLRRSWPRMAMRAAVRGAERVDDARFVALAWDGPFAKMLTRTIDDEAARVFGDRVPQRALLCDVRAMRVVRPHALSGCDVRGGLALFEDRGDAPPRPIAIAVDGSDVVEPDDPRWGLAKTKILSALASCLVLGVHSRLHFPFDVVNAVTRTHLPPRHRLRELLEPHCFVHLSLDYGVLYSDRSVAHNDQRELYTPFAASKEGQLALISCAWDGLPGSAVWARFVYPSRPPHVIGPFGRFLDACRLPIASYVARALSDLDPDDVFVAGWADRLAELLPGFPRAEACRDPEVLAAAVTAFVAGVSLLHSADHYVYSRISVEQVPLRVRVPLPERGQPSSRAPICTRGDLFRQWMAREMFFEVYPLTRLTDLEHTDPELRAGARRLRVELERAVGGFAMPHVPLSMVAASLQY